jgi:poly(3-hydroxyalkanoate) synthetase
MFFIFLTRSQGKERKKVKTEQKSLLQGNTNLVDSVTKLDGEIHDSLKKATVSKYKLKRGLGGFIVTQQETHLCSSRMACQEHQVPVLFVPKSQ